LNKKTKQTMTSRLTKSLQQNDILDGGDQIEIAPPPDESRRHFGRRGTKSWLDKKPYLKFTRNSFRFNRNISLKPSVRPSVLPRIWPKVRPRTRMAGVIDREYAGFG
jgi:hypothetical protein